VNDSQRTAADTVIFMQIAPVGKRNMFSVGTMNWNHMQQFNKLLICGASTRDFRDKMIPKEFSSIDRWTPTLSLMTPPCGGKRGAYETNMLYETIL